MLVDARTVAADESIDADVCIAGAGPAGLVTALELEPCGCRIALLEAGGIGPADEPLDGEVDGAYPALASTRASGIGGTAAAWNAELAPQTFGARYAPLAPIDLEAREDVPRSGWPFGREVLDRFYARAHVLCDAGPFTYDADRWAEDARVPPLPLHGPVTTGVFRFGRRSVFTHDHARRVVRSSTITAFVGATALELELDDSFSIRRLKVGAEPQRAFVVGARLFVIAVGGIESARLLLLSRGRGEAIGNKHDLVGRFFMDHPTARARLIPTHASDARALAVLDVRHGASSSGFGYLTIDPETVRRERLLAGGGIVVPSLDAELEAVASLKALAGSLRHRRLPPDALREVRRVTQNVGSVALSLQRRLVHTLPVLAPTLRLSQRGRLLNTHGIGHVAGWSRLRTPESRSGSFDLYHVLEQAPEPERRIVLGAARDRFGRPVARLHWFISAREVDSMRRSQELIARELARAGIGRVVTTAELVDGADLAAAIHPTAHHHLGTTRMHTDPKHGVVDVDARVHGVSNLYVVGGSVFPTGGFVNPTLTMVALAARLAEHLRTRLKSG